MEGIQIKQEAEIGKANGGISELIFFMCLWVLMWICNYEGVDQSFFNANF